MITQEKIAYSADDIKTMLKTCDKYNKALDKAKEELKVCGSQDCDAARQIFRFFPELKESEDEKMRKVLYADIRTYIPNERGDKYIAWLEKQDEKNINHTDIKEKAHQIAWETSKDYDPLLSKEAWCEMAALDMASWLEKQGEPEDNGEISDGYHTFNELYRYRMLYNAAFFNLLPKELVHKSKRHHDGKECFGGGWFIVMANLPTGQISNHYELKDWDLFQIPEKEIADEWDGHTPQEAAERLHKYLLEKQVEKQTWEPDDAQLIVIKDLIEDKNTSKVNKVILRGMFDEFKQYFEL